MAFVKKCEKFTNATIDASDMTITEYHEDSTLTYSIHELIQRWDGVSDVTISIGSRIPLPLDRGNDI